MLRWFTGCALLPILFAAPLARADVFMSEIMYNPASGFDSDDFIELRNTGESAIDLTNWRVDGIGFTFPEAASIDAGAHLCLARDAAQFQTRYGFAPAYVFTGTLSNGGERLALYNAADLLVDEVTYDDVAPWAATPDGDGPSLELIAPTQPHDTPRNWRASTAAAKHTAGQLNSVNAASLPPWISDVSHTTDPASDQPVQVVCSVLGASSVSFNYRLGFAAEVPGVMFDDGAHGDGGVADGVFGAQIPGQPAGTLIRYRILAVGASSSMRYPRTDDGAVYDGTVVSDSAVSSALPILQWYMSPTDYQNAITHIFSDTTEPASFYYGGRLYDNCRVRVRGHSFSRQFPKKHWKVFFPTGHDFTAPDLVPLPLDQCDLQSDYADKSHVRVVLANESYRDAGCPSNLSFHIRLQQNGQFFGLYTFLEAMDDDYLDRQNLPEDGAWYQAYSDFRSYPLEQLPTYYGKENRQWEGFGDLFAIIDGVNTLTGAARTRFLHDHFDIPGLLNYLAVTCVIHDNDHVAKNYFLFRDSDGTARWTLHQWDKDLTFGRNFGPPLGVLNDEIWADNDSIPGYDPIQSPSHPLFGEFEHQKYPQTWNRLIDAVYDDPTLRSLYLRRLRSVMDLLLAAGRYEARLDQLIAMIGPEAALDIQAWPQYGEAQTLAQATDIIRNDYLPRRRTHLFTTHRVPTRIPEAQAAMPAVVISEIMYEPSGGADHQYVELHNPSMADAVDISNWRIDGIDARLPHGTVIPANGYLVVAKNDLAFRATYPSGAYVAAQYEGNLDGGGEDLVLRNANGAVVDQVRYDDDAPWPTTPDGSGPSLELVDPAQDNNRPANWAASLSAGGTPGEPNSTAGITQPVPTLWVNEVLPINATINVDEAAEFAPWIEVYNHSDAAVDLTGMSLTDDYLVPNKWIIPNGTSIGAGQWLIFWADGQTGQGLRHTSFVLNPAGGSVGLFDTNGIIIDYLNYDALPADVSYGKYPDGQPLRQTFSLPTPQASNIIPPARVILNEYNAVDSNRLLKNNGSDTFFGRVTGNGGDWFELIVIEDHLDMRGWTLRVSDNTNGAGEDVELLVLTNDPIWSNLRSGTIITVAESVASDVSYSPPTGDWWIHVQAANGGSAQFITPTNFPVSNNSWQLTVRDAQSLDVFGPAGEGVRPVSGIGNDEIFKLDEHPAATISSRSNYAEGFRSTFGSPNSLGDGSSHQSLAALRAVCAPSTDIDGSQTLTEADVAAFVSVLLGDDVTPSHIRAADMNCDDNVDGDDLQPFVAQWITP